MALPSIPNNFVLQQGNGQVFLSWDMVAGVISYEVQRCLDNSNWSNLSNPGTNYYLDTTVSINTLYFYRVAGVTADGIGTYTASQSVVPTLQGQMSLGEIRLRAQQRADRENSSFIGKAEWNYFINQSYYELYDLLITVFEDYYVAPRLSISTTGTNLYDLPTGANYSSAPAFYKMYGVDLGLNNQVNAFVSLKKFNFIDRNKYIFPQISSNMLAYFNLEYRLVGGQIMFIPTPASGQTFGLWYFPKLRVLLQDTDILDGISGWTEYVIVDAARKALAKEESDTSVLAQEKAMLMKRIMDSASNRDAGMPDTVSDTRNGANQGMGFDISSWGGY